MNDIIKDGKENLIEKDKGGRPFGTSDEDVAKAATYDKVSREAYMGIRENRRMAKKLMKKALQRMDSNVDYVTIGTVVARYLEAVNHCDRLMVELAKLKREDNIRGVGSSGAMTQEKLFEMLETPQDDEELKDEDES